MQVTFFVTTVWMSVSSLAVLRRPDNLKGRRSRGQCATPSSRDAVEKKEDWLAKTMRTWPMRTALVTGTLQASLADCVVQLVTTGKVDTRRVAAFVAFGFFTVGLVQYTFYARIMPHLFPRATKFAGLSMEEKAKDKQGRKEVLYQLMLDQLFFTPVIYFHFFYVIQELLLGSAGHGLIGAHMQWRENIATDAVKAMRFWLPCQILNYVFIPVWFRMPFMNIAGFFWIILLSYIRGAIGA